MNLQEFIDSVDALLQNLTIAEKSEMMNEDKKSIDTDEYSFKVLRHVIIILSRS